MSAPSSSGDGTSDGACAAEVVALVHVDFFSPARCRLKGILRTALNDNASGPGQTSGRARRTILTAIARIVRRGNTGEGPT